MNLEGISTEEMQRILLLAGGILFSLILFVTALCWPEIRVWNKRRKERRRIKSLLDDYENECTDFAHGDDA